MFDASLSLLRYIAFITLESTCEPNEFLGSFFTVHHPLEDR